MSNYTIETITPVHIGSGVLFQKNTEFLRKNDFIGIIDPSKVLDLIGKEQVSTWVAMIERGEPLLPYLMKRKPGMDLEDVCLRTMNYFAENIETAQSLKEQIHTGTSHPYIPGSSIKGAIRTALFTHLIKAFGKVDEQMLKNRFSTFDDDILSRKLFGKDPNHDSLRFLRVGDCTFDKGTTIAMNMVSLNQRRNNIKLDNKVSQLTEAIGQESTASLRIDIDKEKLEENIKHHKISTDVSFLNSDQELLQTINKHTIHMLKSEIETWEEHKEYDNVDNYILEIKQLLQMAESYKEKEALLRLGHGSGWNFMTGAWQKDSSILTDDSVYDQIINKSRPNNQTRYSEYMFPKTRRMDEEGFLLGFIKIEKKE